MNTIYNDLYLMPVVLNLFDGYTNTTLDAGLSDEMKTYYSMRLINLAEPELIHDQFAQKHPIPKNSGNQQNSVSATGPGTKNLIARRHEVLEQNRQIRIGPCDSHVLFTPEEFMRLGQYGQSRSAGVRQLPSEIGGPKIFSDQSL